MNSVACAQHSRPSVAPTTPTPAPTTVPVVSADTLALMLGCAPRAPRLPRDLPVLFGVLGLVLSAACSDAGPALADCPASPSVEVRAYCRALQWVPSLSQSQADDWNQLDCATLLAAEIDASADGGVQ